MAARVASCRDEYLQQHRLITRSLSRQHQQQLVECPRTRSSLPPTKTLLTGPTVTDSPTRPTHLVSNRGKRADTSSPQAAGTPVKSSKRCKRSNLSTRQEKSAGSAVCDADDSSKGGVLGWAPPGTPKKTMRSKTPPTYECTTPPMSPKRIEEAAHTRPALASPTKSNTPSTPPHNPRTAFSSRVLFSEVLQPSTSSTPAVDEQRARPCTPESRIEAFFKEVERSRANRFLERWNFDITKDEPVEGRWEWTQHSS